MARYIDADALMRQNLTFLWNDVTDQPMFEYIIEKTPTADVVEVRHGRWIMGLDEAEFPYGVCSECNTTWDNDTPYCPNCGAKMDGKE